VRTHPEQAFAAEVERDGRRLTLTLTPRAQKDELGFKEGKLDIGLSRQKLDIPPQYLQKWITIRPQRWFRPCTRPAT